MVAFLVCGDRGGHHHHARSSQNLGAIRQARGRPENVRRPIDLHAVESELRRGHADHFRLGHCCCFPRTIVGFLFPHSALAKRITDAMASGWPHYVLIAAMIFFFSYFWVATQFQPAQIADDLKKHGGYIPGVRPGKPTADFLDYTMTRLTFAGAVFLTLIAVSAQFAQPGASRSADHSAIFRRNELAHYRGCNA